MTHVDHGYINAHTHLYSGLAPLGLPRLDPPARSFLEILERLWWRLDRALDHDLLRASAEFYIANALLCGTTALIDHHESPNCIEGSLDILADVCQTLRMRALICYGITERNRGEKEATAGLEETRRFLENNRRPLVRGAVGMHAAFTLSDDSIRRAGKLARDYSVPVHVHVAEDRIDVSDAVQRGYDGPLERLRALDAIPAGAILAHGVFLTPNHVRYDVPNLNAWLVHNPRSNENNGVGYARVLGPDHRVALGTDGFPSNMRDELAALQRIAKSAEDPHFARLGPARLNASAKLRRELFGARDDDLVEWDDSSDEPRVQRVIIAGREVVRQGQLVSGDLSTIVKNAKQAAKRLFQRMQTLGDES